MQGCNLYKIVNYEKNNRKSYIDNSKYKLVKIDDKENYSSIILI